MVTLAGIAGVTGFEDKVLVVEGVVMELAAGTVDVKVRPLAGVV